MHQEYELGVNNSQKNIPETVKRPGSKLKQEAVKRRIPRMRAGKNGT